MQIWLNTARTSGPKNALCGGPKNGACAAACRPPASALTISPGLLGSLTKQELRIQQSTPLHIQPCGEERWLVCNPVGAGQLVILDREAITLFKQFQTPVMASQVINASCEVTPKAGRVKAIALFLQLGLLQSLDTPNHSCTVSDPRMLVAWLHITNACNLRCAYCFLKKTSEHMSSDTGRQAIEAIFRSALKHGMQGIDLKYAGGEASLRMQHVIELHNYASQLAKQHDLVLDDILLSNGVMLSQRTIDDLKALQIKVQISLDGLGVYHDSQRSFIKGQGSFDHVICTIDRLLASDLVPQISITVSQRNLDGLVDFTEYVLERQLPFSFSFYIENEYSAQITDLQFASERVIATMNSVFRVIEQHLPQSGLWGSIVDLADISMRHHNTCGVGQNYLVIDHDGSIAKCPMQIKEAVTTIHAEDPLQAIKDDRKGIQGLAVDEKEGCQTCDWRYWCTGGCPLLTYRATGRYDMKSPNCNIYKALLPATLRLEGLRLLQYEQPLVLC